MALKTKVIIAIVAAVVLSMLTIGLAVGLTVGKKEKNSVSTGTTPPVTTIPPIKINTTITLGVNTTEVTTAILHARYPRYWS